MNKKAKNLISTSIIILIISLLVFSPLFVLAEEPQPEEPTITRTAYTTKTCYPDGHCIIYESKGQINYYNGSEYLPINKTIISSSDPSFDYEVTKGIYQAYFNSNPTQGQIVKFIANNTEITFQPMALQYESFYGGLDPVSMIQSVQGVPNGSIFLYENAYGSGIDLRYKYTNMFLKEDLIIDSFSDLSLPPEYMFEQGEITLNLDFVLATDSNHIVIEGVDWDKSTTKETSNEVYIKDDEGNILYYFRKPYAYDSTYSSQLLKYQFKKSEQSLYVILKTPYSWLSNDSLVYPVYIDPTLNYQEDANATECDEADWDDTYPCSNTYDGDWDTYGYADAFAEPGGSVYFNYTKFPGATNLSKWEIKGNSTVNPVRTNLTINSDCWDEDPIQFRAFSSGGLGWGSFAEWSCCSPCGSKPQWILLQEFTESGEITPSVKLIFEEAMWWYMTPIIVSSPTNSTYNTTTINFNITATDDDGISTCLYSLTAGIKNYTMLNDTATHFYETNSSMTQGSHTVTFYCNDTLNNINTETQMFSIDSIKPNISLDTPTNYQNISNGIDVYFNFTATDAGGLDTCQLWHNGTGTWHKNYSWVGPTSDTQNHTTVNISEGRFKYNMWCNDTANNFNWSTSNFTFTVDETNPIVNITTENDTTISEAQSITVEYNISDTYLKQCYFSLRTPGGVIHNYPENTSLSCTSTSRTISTLVFGTFVLQIWGEDYVGNLDYENLTFTTYFGGPGSGGGGGITTTIEEEINVTEKTFCGDGICQKEGNDYGIKENFYNCANDCPGFDFDEFIWSFSRYCFDNDTSTICAFTQLFATAPMEGFNVTVAVCGDGVCEPSENVFGCQDDCGKLSGKTLISQCFDNDSTTPCFWSSNLSYLILFFGGSGILLVSVTKIKFPGEKKKVSPYNYVVKKWGRKKR